MCNGRQKGTDIAPAELTSSVQRNRLLRRGRRTSRTEPPPVSTAEPLTCTRCAGEGAPRAGDLQSRAAPQPPLLLCGEPGKGWDCRLGAAWGRHVGTGCGAQPGDRSVWAAAGDAVCRTGVWSSASCLCILSSVQCHQHHGARSKTAQGQSGASGGVRNGVLGAPTDERGGSPHPCRVCLGQHQEAEGWRCLYVCTGRQAAPWPGA